MCESVNPVSPLAIDGDAVELILCHDHVHEALSWLVLFLQLVIIVVDNVQAPSLALGLDVSEQRPQRLDLLDLGAKKRFFDPVQSFHGKELVLCLLDAFLDLDVVEVW
jgi:hypothetical protein